MASNRLEEAPSKYLKKQGIKATVEQPSGGYPSSETGVPISVDQVREYSDFGKPFPDTGLGSEHGVNYYGRVFKIPKEDDYNWDYWRREQ